MVVVDTGSPSADWVNHHHRPFDRTPDEDPAEAMSRAGIDPGTVETVVLSHLHYDHCANNHLFPRAEFIVHADEIAYALAPHAVHAETYEAPQLGFRPRWLDTMDRTTVIRSDREIAPGITVVHLPGHTPGLLGTIVTTDTGRVAITSDHCSRFESWEGLDDLEVIPSKVYVDLNVYYDSFEELRGLADLVLPSHDMRVFDRRTDS